jgi:hypothetical protein
MTNEEEVDDFTSKVFDVMERYAQIVDDGLQERWSLLREKVELYDSETYEVAIGLVARQATLTIHLAVNPGMWTGHIAPLVLRAMTDAHITLAWILQDPPARARRCLRSRHLRPRPRDAAVPPDRTPGADRHHPARHRARRVGAGRSS